MTGSVVCTGKSGSIGASLPDAVYGLATRLEAKDSEMHTELARLSRPSTLIHLAAMTSVQDCEKNPERAFDLNVSGSLKWLRAAARSGIDHFVFVSTAHVFKPTEDPILLEPSRPGNATSVYGRTKWAAETQLRAESERLSVRLAIARVFSVIAPPGKSLRSGYLQAGLQRRARERDFSPLEGYKNVRDFIDTDQICRQLVSLAENSQSGIFHICTGRPKSVRELAIEIFNEYDIGVEQMRGMFPEDGLKGNYLISKPSLKKASDL